MILEFLGKVTLGDTYRERASVKKAAVFINDFDFLGFIHYNKKIIIKEILIQLKSDVEVYKGNVVTDIGFSNQSYPREPDYLYVNDFNLLKRIIQLEGEDISIQFFLKTEDKK